MPVKNPGSYPTSSDVFYSKNVFINGIEVALWNAPAKGPASKGGASAASVANQQQDQNQTSTSSSSAPADTQSAESTTSNIIDPAPPPVVPPNSGLSGQSSGDTTSVVLPEQTPEANVALSAETLATYSATVASFVANPDSYRMQLTNALSGNIKSCFPGTLRNLSLDPLTSIAPKQELVPLLTALSVFSGEGLLGSWKETGTQGFQSNRNIIGLFADLGYDTSIPPFNSDQTPWSMALVNWTLKRTGFRYTQSVDAFDIKNRTSDWGATEIALANALPGDIAVWDFGHVNFVNEKREDGKLTFIGGCQAQPSEPNIGTIAVSWQDGYDPVNNNGSLLKIYRPSKV
jgi:hypothetical protein